MTLRGLELKVTLAGASTTWKNPITVNPGITRCGHIQDGVAFDYGQGPFVMSFKDLARIYLAAKDVRLAAADERAKRSV